MGKIDVDAMMQGMRARLQQDEAEGRLAGLTVEDLMDAVSHPKAPEAIAETMALEAGSVQEGEPAPDFSLPWLPAGRETPPGRMTLSEHFGKKPVALIFGSYT
ncbi:MAG: hypothetical protein OEM05_05315 [Myxococcales bacterium]|nr:hypothetical protein [Myxococcales bacterium]